MSTPERTVVTVQIAGEEYNIRALASPEYTRDCAAYVDRTLSEIMKQSSLLPAQKGAILAALALADELFQTRTQLESLRAELVRRATSLSATIEERLSGVEGSGA